MLKLYFWFKFYRLNGNTVNISILKSMLVMSGERCFTSSASSQLDNKKDIARLERVAMKALNRA